MKQVSAPLPSHPKILSQRTVVISILFFFFCVWVQSNVHRDIRKHGTIPVFDRDATLDVEFERNGRFGRQGNAFAAFQCIGVDGARWQSDVDGFAHDGDFDAAIATARRAIEF